MLKPSIISGIAAIWVAVLHSHCVLHYTQCQSVCFWFCGGEDRREVRSISSSFIKIKSNNILIKMALKLNPTIYQSPKFPAFALPPMASLRSPKFFMASTLRSGSKSVFVASTFSILSLYFFYKKKYYVWINVWILVCFHVLEVFFGSGLLLFYSLICFMLPSALSYASSLLFALSELGFCLCCVSFVFGICYGFEILHSSCF